jgi:hypothetical protein
MESKMTDIVEMAKAARCINDDAGTEHYRDDYNARHRLYVSDAA